ncbi:membrane protein [Aliivibrio wodanis]|uniref:Membrane protein n=1 Tax=Aliivibrio wodanis TaxID=80852 RepID=A0A090KL41_9GAMM|nr:membrane protein [Aliivibrio wodanis]
MIVLINTLPFPLIPLLFYFLYQHCALLYHQLLDQQGSYTFVKRESDDHRDWVVTRVFWISKSVCILQAKNVYTKKYFYLFGDMISINKQHQLAVLLR